MPRGREVSAAGNITTIAGNDTRGYSGDTGQATAAQLYSPMGLAVDSAGNLYVSDSGNHLIRVINTSGVIRTFGSDLRHRSWFILILASSVC